MTTTQPKGEQAATWLPLTDLTPWADNPRVNDHAVPEVAKSIKRFGFASPIIARPMDGGGLEVIAGHTRLKAAESLGLDRVPVRVMDLDPTDAKLLALADNKVGELAEWSSGLDDVLRQLADDGVSLEGIGWSDDELAELLDFDVPDPVAPDPVVLEAGQHPAVLHLADCFDVMAAMAPDSVDAIVCDPPYGIGFMGKEWDALPPGEDWARACLRVLKPGGHMVAFGGTRTVHRLACAIEDAGFEIRDTIAWVQWQGFPKSLAVGAAIDKAAGAVREVIGQVPKLDSYGAHTGPIYGGSPDHGGVMKITAPATEDARRWEAYGTALKPAHEPAILARKPMAGTVAANVLEHGTGALNIDGCRYAYGDTAWPGPQGEWSYPDGPGGNTWTVNSGPDGSRGEPTSSNDLGRWPANLYACPKPSRSEREAGCERLPARTGAEATARTEGTAGMGSPGAGAGRTAEQVKNHHPTVKPLAVMRWLCRLVGGQPGAVIFDPFMGSGTAGCAAALEGFAYIGAELNPEYHPIAVARIRHHHGDRADDMVTVKP